MKRKNIIYNRGNSVSIKSLSKNNNSNNKEYFDKIISDLENKFNNQLNIMQDELNEKFKIFQNKIDTIQNQISNIFSFENKFDKNLENFKKEILNLVNSVKSKTEDNIKPENHINIINENKNIIDKVKLNFREKEINNFIKICKIDELGYEYYTPNDIEEKNEEISTFLNEKIYDDYLDDKEKCVNENAGNFLYSIGGISRISFQLANDIYHELFNEYKKYLKSNNESLEFFHEKDRRNLSIWIKKCLIEKNFYEYYSNKNINIIEKYLNKDDEKTNDILFKLFKDFIELYIKCYLSFPPIEIKYTKEHIDFNPKSMKDFILKNAKIKKVNFCYLPGLISNGEFINNGKYNVFTYTEKTYKIRGKVFGDLIKGQNTELYKIPNKKDLKIKINLMFDERKSNCNINVEIKPSIPPDLNPKFFLFKVIGQNKFEFISENDKGIFKMNKENFKKFFCVKFSYASFGLDSEIFRLEI